MRPLTTLTRLILAGSLTVLCSCAQDSVADEPTPSTRNAPSYVIADPAEDTFALGSKLTTGGAVASPSVQETYNRGENLFLSVDLTGSSQRKREVEVRWQSNKGEVRRNRGVYDARRRRYATFESGMTGAWRPGAYRAVVVIDGRQVAERPFQLR